MSASDSVVLDGLSRPGRRGSGCGSSSVDGDRRSWRWSWSCADRGRSGSVAPIEASASAWSLADAGRPRGAAAADARDGGQPPVDDRLDDAAAAQRAADERPPALRVEVRGQRGRRRRSARGRGRPRPRRRHRGSRSPSASATFESTSSVLTRFSAFGPEVGVEVVAGLLDGLEVGLLGDALARERARNSSCITSTSWSTSTSGSSTVALATAYSMIRSANSWRARSSALRLEPRLDVGPQRVEVGRSRRACARKSSSRSGRIFSRSSLRSTAKWAVWPASDGLAVVVGERDVELRRVADA